MVRVGLGPVTAGPLGSGKRSAGVAGLVSLSLGARRPVGLERDERVGCGEAEARSRKDHGHGSDDRPPFHVT